MERCALVHIHVRVCKAVVPQAPFWLFNFLLTNVPFFKMLIISLKVCVYAHMCTLWPRCERQRDIFRTWFSLSAIQILVITLRSSSGLANFFT